MGLVVVPPCWLERERVGRRYDGKGKGSWAEMNLIKEKRKRVKKMQKPHGSKERKQLFSMSHVRPHPGEEAGPQHT